MTRCARAGGALVAALLAVLCAAVPAAAGPLVADAECEDVQTDTVFLPWVDPMEYALLPNGGMETGEAWKHQGSHRVADNEPWTVRDPRDDAALELPDGSRATSGVMCAGLGEPTLRFFAKRLNGSSAALLQVDVLFEDSGGNVRAVPIGLVSNPGEWRPTLPLALLINLLPVLPGEKTPVAFRFTPRGDADWRIDDVYLDPMRRH
jgi:hypothetical protein